MDFNSIVFPLHYLKNNYSQDSASGSKTLSNFNDNLRQEELSDSSMDGENKMYTSEMISENLKDFIFVPRKNGKTKSVGVQPFQDACCKGGQIELQEPGMLTKIIPAIVIPLKTSREISLSFFSKIILILCFYKNTYKSLIITILYQFLIII